jgi:glycosyltransferase involved in cell wall biosynthesis
MAAADIYCQPNTEPEPFGVAMVEAMYAGCPVITTPAGGACDGRCAIVVPAGDPAKLSAAIADLSLSAPRRRELGLRGRDVARERCDPHQQIETLFGLLARAHVDAGARV